MASKRAWQWSKERAEVRDHIQKALEILSDGEYIDIPTIEEERDLMWEALFKLYYDIRPVLTRI